MANERTPEDRMTRLETTVWGSHGTNGLTADSRRHSQQIGELFGRDEGLQRDIDALRSEIQKQFGKLYIMLAGAALTVVVALLGLIAAVVGG